MPPFYDRSQTFPPVKFEGTQVNNSLTHSHIHTHTHSHGPFTYPDPVPSPDLTAIWASELVNW